MRVVEFPTAGDQFRNDWQAIEIISEAAAHNAEVILIPVERLIEDFFDLKTRIAGEILQKFVTYRKRVVILGDISNRLSRSSALRDFVYECNAGHQVCSLQAQMNLIESYWPKRDSPKPGRNRSGNADVSVPMTTTAARINEEKADLLAVSGSFAP